MEHNPLESIPMRAYTIPSESSSRSIVVATFSSSLCGGASATRMKPSRLFLMSQSLVAVESAIGFVFSSSTSLLELGACALLISYALLKACALCCALKIFRS